VDTSLVKARIQKTIDKGQVVINYCLNYCSLKIQAADKTKHFVVVCIPHIIYTSNHLNSMLNADMVNVKYVGFLRTICVNAFIDEVNI